MLIFAPFLFYDLPPGKSTNMLHLDMTLIDADVMTIDTVQTAEQSSKQGNQPEAFPNRGLYTLLITEVH